MIRNERQYKITKAAAEKFRVAIAKHQKAPPAKGVHPKLRKAELEAMRVKLAELEQDMTQYESLKSKGAKVLRGDLGDIGGLLVQARIARHWTQLQLAERLDLHMQQIQAYEANNYDGASVTRLVDVARALGASVKLDMNLLEIPTLVSAPALRPPRRKFQIGDRVSVNEKAPGDYRARTGRIAELAPQSEYRVDFSDGERPESGYLGSWCLDKVE